jgi:hypothetical protein
MAKTGWALLAFLLALPASGSVVYTFTETWSNPYNTAHPTGTFGFSFGEPTFLPDSGPHYIPGSQFLTCDLSGMDPRNTCSGAWVAGDTNSVSVELLASYPCPGCEFNPYPLASVYFAGADLQAFGNWMAPSGVNSTAELVITDPPDVVSVPEPVTLLSVLVGFGALAGYRGLRSRRA